MIKKVLQSNNINFIQEYVFEDLRGKLGKPYRFDFAVFQNNQLLYLIEFDGK